jgi:hypothetical protein
MARHYLWLCAHRCCSMLSRKAFLKSPVVGSCLLLLPAQQDGAKGSRWRIRYEMVSELLLSYLGSPRQNKHLAHGRRRRSFSTPRVQAKLGTSETRLTMPCPVTGDGRTVHYLTTAATNTRRICADLLSASRAIWRPIIAS